MISGDVSTFLNALGAREGDEALERALAFVGGDHEIDVFDEDGVVDEYLVMADRGVVLLLTDGRLSTVFVHAVADDDNGVYGGWETFVDGVAPGSSRDDLVRALGEPLKSAESFVRYRAEPGFVQFEFADGGLEKAVVMLEVIGGQAVEAEAPRATTVDGDLAVFMRAIGRAMFSPEHFAVIGLTGPATESHDDDRDGVVWQYENSSRTGVTLQFKQEFLVGALIRLLGDEGEAVYPSPDLLVAGLPLPARREAVEARFGTPRRSSETMDLYLVDDLYLRFDFEAGRTSSVGVVSPGVEV